MNLKKYIALIWLMAVSFGFVSAQTVTLHMKDGTSQIYDYSTLDYMEIEPASQGPKLDVTVSDVRSTSVKVSVACDDSDVAYYYDVCTAEDFERVGRNVGSIISNVIKSVSDYYQGQLTLEQILEAMLDSGNSSDEIKMLPAGTDMYCYAMAVDKEGNPYGTATVVPFRTLEAGDPAQCTFDISASSVWSGGCTVNITPSDPSVRYWYGLVAVAGYPGDVVLTSDIRDAIAQVASENGMSIEQVVRAVCFTDATSNEESGLEASTSYYIYAYAMTDDGRPAGPVTKKRFTTTDYDASDAAISLAYRYYDGDELYGLDPVAYAKYKGRVMVDAKITPNEYAAHWVFALGANDMTDKDIYPDDATMDAILQGGVIDKDRYTFVANWGEATFIYFAADQQGVNGELKRLKVDFDKEGCSPVESLQLSSTSKISPNRKIMQRLSDPKILKYRK